MKLPYRKHPRLKEYDYAGCGGYFVTFCTKNRKHLLSSVAVGRDALIPPEVELSSIGKVVDEQIRKTEDSYENIHVDRYVIMPNHVHLLLRIEEADGGMRASRPTVQMVVRAIKSLTTRKIGSAIWQTSFYDHVIRNETDYLSIWEYIEGNPAKWADDPYYCEESR